MATKKKPPDPPRPPLRRTPQLRATLATTKTSTSAASKPPAKERTAATSTATTRTPITAAPTPSAPSAIAPRPPRPSPAHGPGAPIPTSPAAVFAELLRLVDDVANNFYRIGACLRVIKQTNAHPGLGFSSFSAMVEALQRGTRFHAYQLMEVASALPEPVALELGISRAYRTVRLLANRQPGVDPAKIIAADPAIDVFDDEPPVPLSTLDVKMLDAAIRKLRGKSVPGKRRAQAAARALAQVLEHAGIDPARVRSRLTSRGWEVSVDLPPEEAEDLARLLSRRKR